VSSTPPTRSTGGAAGRSGSSTSNQPSSKPSSTATAATKPAAPSGPPTSSPSVSAVTGGGDGQDARRVMGYRRQRFEARKVRRLVRHIDPWSALKLSVLVALSLWLITMIASVILWTVARNAGTVSSVEEFVNSTFSLQEWKLDGEFLFRQFSLLSLMFYLGVAGAIVVATLVFNLISDIIGGIWISVIEEETARPM
jgi:hypothetical protein